MKEQRGESIIDNNVVIINRTLWPMIFERSYDYSASIYDMRATVGCTGHAEEVERMKCSTGLFHLVRRYVPTLFAGGGGHQYDNGDSPNASTSTTCTTCTTCTTTDAFHCDENQDDGGFKTTDRKRKRSNC
jgi:hypothetical protein